MGLIDEAVVAIKIGEPVILPTDTVYGLCTTPYREDPVRRLHRLKDRPHSIPTALLASDVDMLFECVPELRGRSGVIARTLLPGPYTLVLSNPSRRFRWLTGTSPETIGVRVPELEDDAREIVARVGAVAATSANVHGGLDPARLDEVPESIRAACAALVDAGELPGTPSTVIDFTWPEPRVIREGAGDAGEALARVAEALGAPA